MENNTMKEKNLKQVFFTLFKEIKKAAKGGWYPVYLAKNVEVISDGNIKFKSEARAENLRDCLKSFGDLLYELATGSSALNSLSSYIDPVAKPIESELWPAISMMISGNAYSIPQVEDLVKKETSGFYKFAGGLKEFFGKISLFLAGATAKILRHMSNNLEIFRYVIFGAVDLACIVLAFWYIYVNLSFSNPYFLAFVVVVYAIFVILLNFFAINERIATQIKYFLAIVFLMLFLVGSSFVYYDTKTKEPMMLVNRGNNEFVAFLPMVNDTLAKEKIWDKWYINHFKNRLISTKFTFLGSMEKPLAFDRQKIKKDGGIEEVKTDSGFRILLDYRILEGAFNETDEQGREKLHASVSKNLTKELEKSVIPKLNDVFFESMKDFTSLEISPEEIFFDNTRLYKKRAEMLAKFRAKLAETLKSEIEKIDFPVSAEFLTARLLDGKAIAAIGAKNNLATEIKMVPGFSLLLNYKIPARVPQVSVNEDSNNRDEKLLALKFDNVFSKSIKSFKSLKVSPEEIFFNDNERLNSYKEEIANKSKEDLQKALRSEIIKNDFPIQVQLLY